jgi:tetratricopeptide (TPR) repeat protein
MNTVPPSKRADDPVTRLALQGLALIKDGRAADLLNMVAQAPAAVAAASPVLAQRAYGHALQGQHTQALAMAEQAMRNPPSQLWALDLLGQVFTHCHRPERAHAAFTHAQRAAPGRPEVLFNLATTAAFLGRAEEAEQSYDRVIAASPGHAEAWHNRSLLRRQTRGRNHVAPLRAALGEGPLPWQDEVHLRYALGKELEDLEEYDGAFASIARGGAIRRQHMRYAVAEDVEAMRHIAATHDTAWCAPAATGKTPESRGGPIFILGMPRSGSTLLERMLGRHPQVQPLGELQFFGQALVGSFRASTGRMPAGKAELIAASADLDLHAVSAAYHAAVAPLRAGAARFTDKLPINFLYAGLIARALPDATLLHTRRRPLDLCFAIYKTLFRDAYPYSYDLAELAAYHQAYEALMAHWRRSLGKRLVEVDYEDVVSDPRETLCSLLPRLGLDFDEACLNPQEDRTAVMTASAAQVRQAIHADSVGSADRYGAHLDPLRAALSA